MKKLTAFIFVLTIGSTVLALMSSCKKYEDGPLISFRTRTERLSNTWEVYNYTFNGNDLTSLYTNCTETFSKGGDYSYSCGLFDGAGKWKFQSNDERIQLTGNEDKSNRNLKILKLEEDAFWYSTDDGGDVTELHMVTKK
jgi:hypothetical protein